MKSEIEKTPETKTDTSEKKHSTEEEKTASENTDTENKDCSKSNNVTKCDTATKQQNEPVRGATEHHHPRSHHHDNAARPHSDTGKYFQTI